MASSNPKIPYVRDGHLYRHDGTLICAVASSLAERSVAPTARVQATGWYDWLEDGRNKSFAFFASNGAHCTAIKEKRRSSSGRVHYYWFAYRSIEGEKRRVSLGKSHGIDLARLSEAATRLAQLELVFDAATLEPQAPEAALPPKPKKSLKQAISHKLRELMFGGRGHSHLRLLS